VEPDKEVGEGQRSMKGSSFAYLTDTSIVASTNRELLCTALVKRRIAKLRRTKLTALLPGPSQKAITILLAQIYIPLSLQFEIRPKGKQDLAMRSCFHQDLQVTQTL